ncbi:MAG: sugar phosphate isomerase/epimerase [Clostridia bacterium]|nr:sugar phosphate isomerase/epimerase [Clostridia bacterium]
MKNFVVGAQLYSVRPLMQTEQDIAATFKAIREMGYTTCQLSGQNRSIPSEKIAELLKEAGLKCVVTHNSMKDFEEDIDALIQRHKTWNCAYAGLGAMPKEYHEDIEGFRSFAKKANAFAERLADDGITFVYHNHAFEFARYDGVLGMDVLFDEFGPKTQFELDTYWVQEGGANPAKWIRRVDGRMDVGHFKDMAGQNSNTSLMVPFGCGNLDWDEIRLACEETHVKYMEIEQDNAADKPDPLGEMRMSADNLKKLGFTL